MQEVLGTKRKLQEDLMDTLLHILFYIMVVVGAYAIAEEIMR